MMFSKKVSLREKYPSKYGPEVTLYLDTFHAVLQNLDCLSILLMCLRNLETQVNCIFKESAESKESRIKDDKQLQDLNASITLLSEKFNDYEKKRKIKDQIIENLQNSKISMEK